jgi:hypothetical protein
LVNVPGSVCRGWTGFDEFGEKLHGVIGVPADGLGNGNHIRGLALVAQDGRRPPDSEAI